MKDGFLKVGAATLEIRVADCVFNGDAIISRMREAAERGLRLLVLPELCVTGYTCGDLFLQDCLLNGAVEALHRIVQASAEMELLTVVGLPLTFEGKLYNCAAVVFRGGVLGIVPKTNLPNYGEFYEKRHFTPAPLQNGEIVLLGERIPFGSKLLFQCAAMPEFTLGVEICEDLWAPLPPSTGLCLGGAAVIANLSASDETAGKAAYRRELVCGQSGRMNCAYLYADAGEGESTTDMVFAGHNLIAEDGVLLCESGLFRNEMAVSDVDLQRIAYERRRITTFPSGQGEYRRVLFEMGLGEMELERTIVRRPFVPENQGDRAARCEEILAIQSYGLRKRIAHTRCKKVVLGISGGLDSSLALLVAARAMDLLQRPRTDIVAVTMPCFGTTRRTRSNAELLTLGLGAQLRTVDITKAVLQHFEDIGHPYENHDVTFENSQARERTQVLMDIANQEGGLVIGTGDLSELALGWATYNGDHMSMYGVNASIPKTLIRHIVQYEADISRDEKMRQVLYDILDTPVSPELLPAKDGEISQKTESLVGPYELHDFFLYYMIRWGFSPKKILRLAGRAFEGEYDRETILFWIRTFYRRFFAQQFKRSCLPDGPKVGSVTLSPRGDWRMPSDACAALWLDELEGL